MMRSLLFSAFSVKDFIHKISQENDFKPTLGVIFSSPAVDISELVKATQSLDFPVLGCSTDGEITNFEPDHPVLQQSIVWCLLDMPTQAFNVGIFEKKNETSFVLGQKIGHWGKQQFEEPGFIICIGGIILDGEAIIRGMQKIIPKDSPIIGGTAGDDGEFKRTVAFTNKEITDEGVVVLVIDRSKINLVGFTTSGWTGVGTEMTVTSSEGNVVRSLNGRPTVDVLQEYLKMPKEDLISIGVRFPLIVYRADGTQVLRAPLSADLTNGAVIFAGSVPQGSKVRFSSSFGYETIEQAIRDLNQYHKKMPKADLILAFSCTARHYAAGSMIKDEIIAINNLWGAPVLGFFTYGEIGQSITNTCDFFNETLSLAVIREKS